MARTKDKVSNLIQEQEKQMNKVLLQAVKENPNGTVDEVIEIAMKKLREKVSKML